MLFLIRATLAGGLIGAAMAEGAALAAVDAVPTFNVGTSCRAASQQAASPAATAGGNPTYTELLTCIEMARDARQLRGKGEPTTTGQGVK